MKTSLAAEDLSNSLSDSSLVNSRNNPNSLSKGMFVDQEKRIESSEAAKQLLLDSSSEKATSQSCQTLRVIFLLKILNIIFIIPGIKSGVLSNILVTSACGSM